MSDEIEKCPVEPVWDSGNTSEPTTRYVRVLDLSSSIRILKKVTVEERMEGLENMRKNILERSLPLEANRATDTERARAREFP